MSRAMTTGTARRAELLSCDVFDTVLIRRVGSPSAVFLILGARLARKGQVSSTPEAFARARIEANRRARVNAGRGMALADIYSELQFALGLTDEEREAIRREELALEAELLLPVPGVGGRLRQARESGMAVTFLSDMYLGSAFLLEQLERHGMALAGERCHVSCEAGCGKEDGRGFRLMATREGVELGRIVHRGNDPRADIAAAMALGIATEPFLQGNMHRYEEVLDSHAYATGGLSSVVAGASRLARLSISAGDPREIALRDVAASIVAPALVGYALWMLHRARGLGIRHLVFLPSSGSMLMQVAIELNRRLGMELELTSLSSAPRAESVSPGRTRTDAPIGSAQGTPRTGSEWALVGGATDDAFLESPDRIPRTDGGPHPAVFVLVRSGELDGEPPADAGRVHAYLADHTLGLGYRTTAGEPGLALLLGWEHRAVAADPGCDVVRRTIASVAEHLWLDPESLDLEADLRPALNDVMATFRRTPSRAEAEAWGAFPGGEGQDGGESPVPPPFSLKHLPGAFVRGGLESGPGIAWPEASLVLTPPVTRALLTTAVRLRDRLGRVGRKVRRLLRLG